MDRLIKSIFFTKHDTPSDVPFSVLWIFFIFAKKKASKINFLQHSFIVYII